MVVEILGYEFSHYEFLSLGDLSKADLNLYLLFRLKNYDLPIDVRRLDLFTFVVPDDRKHLNIAVKEYIISELKEEYNLPDRGTLYTPKTDLTPVPYAGEYISKSRVKIPDKQLNLLRQELIGKRSPIKLLLKHYLP